MIGRCHTKKQQFWNIIMLSLSRSILVWIFCKWTDIWKAQINIFHRDVNPSKVIIMFYLKAAPLLLPLSLLHSLLCSCGDPPHHCRELPVLKSLIVEFHVLPLYSAVLCCAGPTLQSSHTKGWFQRKFIWSMIVKLVYRLYGGVFDVRFPCQASLQMKGPGQAWLSWLIMSKGPTSIFV